MTLKKDNNILVLKLLVFIYCDLDNYMPDSQKQYDIVPKKE